MTMRDSAHLRGSGDLRTLGCHVGGGGHAAAIPSPLHPGSGGIHNVERGAGIWGADDPVAGVLQRLLEGTRP